MHLHWPALIRIAIGLVITAYLWATARRNAWKNAAQNITDRIQQLYSGPQQYAPVRVADIPGIDHAHFDRGQADLEARGFRCLGDFENVSVSRVSGNRNCIRRFIGDDDHLIAAIYQLTGRGIGGSLTQRPCYFDFETEFTDGTFLCTSNTDNTKTSPIPGIISQRRPQLTPIDELLELHRTKLAELTSQGLVPRPVTSIDEYAAAQHRQHELKCRHRQSQGYVDIAQVQALAANRGLQEHCTPLYDELATLQKQNIATATPPPIPTERV